MKNPFKIAVELFVHEVVDEGIDAAVKEPEPVNKQHGEEEVGLLEETALLHLADECDDIERRPRHYKRDRHHHHHPRNLQRRRRSMSHTVQVTPALTPESSLTGSEQKQVSPKNCRIKDLDKSIMLYKSW